MHRTAMKQFAAAVLAFSEDPDPENLERYLAASRALEESRQRSRSPSGGRRSNVRRPDRAKAKRAA
jgi:hypothetical protein